MAGISIQQLSHEVAADPCLGFVVVILNCDIVEFFQIGPSAWQNWTYEVKISTQDLPEITHVFSDIRETMLNVPELQSATKYKVSVRACSPKGSGPWSVPSVGTTLVPGEKMFQI